MLSGMALELIYKAIVVANGREPNTSSHDLAGLANDAGIKVKEKQNGLLAILAQAIIWYGRYPVPKKQEELKNMSNLIDTHLFDTIDSPTLNQELYTDERNIFGEQASEFIQSLRVLVPNDALNWNTFNELWNDALEVYGPLHEKEILDNKESQIFGYKNYDF